MNQNKDTKDEPSIIGQTFAFFIIYIVVITVIPYYLFHHAPFSIFITYFANVDIVCNILAINYPFMFDKIYDISPTTFLTYVSYNIISLIALSGIFLYGLESKNHKMSDSNIFISMIVMTIVTWTLPTDGIPYITKKILNYVKLNNIVPHKNDKDVLLFISTIVSLGFILLEGIFIHMFLIHKNTHILGHSLH